MLHQGKIYFTASIWPFMGIFVHAIDPDTGTKVWSNTGDGTNYIIHPHGAPSFGTVAPQGHLTATGNHIVVPGGRSTPAVYDSRDGQLTHFRFEGRVGGSNVMAAPNSYFVGGKAFHVFDGKSIGSATPGLIGPEHIVYAGSGDVIQFESAKNTVKVVMKKDRKGKDIPTPTFTRKAQFRLTLQDMPGKHLLQAGSQIYVAGEGRVAAYDMGANPQDGATLKPLWTAVLPGTIDHLLAGNDRLFAVTREGRLHCLGPKQQPLRDFPLAKKMPERVGNEWNKKVEQLIKANNINGGYAVVLGVHSGEVIHELLAKTQLKLIVIESDATKADAIRRTLQHSGAYGTRVSVHVADPATMALPNYIANLIISEDAGTHKLAANMYEVLRPYGGMMCLTLTEQQRTTLANTVKAKKLAKAELRQHGDFTALVRVGALPNTDNWSHQYANATQSGISGDKLVKAPLGLLWFGGPSHEGILPRHGHGPSPQVAGGRLFIEGPDMLRATDVYTGRVLWEKQLKDFGKYYNTTRHFPGAGEIGSNYVSLPDKVYAVYGNAILDLDAATGKLNREFKLEPEDGQEPPFWGFIAVSGDYLIATSSPVQIGSVKISNTPKSAKPKGTVDIIKRHAVWQYLAGSDPTDDWTTVKFDTKGWKSGPTGIGYGDGDDKTVLNMRGKYTRVYIRNSFDKKDVAGARSLGLAINYDDAFIAYLNGKEILRQGVGRGRGKSAGSIGSHEAERFSYFPIKGFEKLLVEGKNILAIEGHNTSSGSSDFSLDPILVAEKGASAKPKPKSVVKNTPVKNTLPTTQYSSGSKKLVVFNRHTGELLWTREANFNFRHNNIAIGAGKVFCIDSLTNAQQSALERRGIKLQGQPSLLALDAKTGDKIWSTQENIFGTFLNYSVENDILLQGGSSYRDRARDEINRGIVAYRGKDGKVLWKNSSLSYSGPCLLWHDKILTNGQGGFAIDMKTGKSTGWKYSRQYGCNTALGSEHLLTFRSGCAGFFDLQSESGTANLGGFRSSCTNNLIIADGVLNAPDYTRTCTCAYQNQTSLALVHMPEAELWTFGGQTKGSNIGLNLGAPGDRRSDNGTLWKPKAKVTIEPKEFHVFRIHSSLIKGDDLKWVAASGATELQKLTFDVPQDKKYKVKLVFLESQPIKAGARVFDVLVQGKPVLPGFDIVREGGDAWKQVTREFTVEPVDGHITIELRGKTKMPTTLSGVEVIPQ